MGNIGKLIQSFFKNKNSLVLIGVLAGIVVIYIGYSAQVNRATESIAIPYAKVEISSRTVITRDMIGTYTIPKTVADKQKNLIKSSAQVINKYVAYNVTIPVNSFFYTSSVINDDSVKVTPFTNIPDGYTIYALDVNLHSTYGNSIYPGNYIDLYLKARDDSGKIIYGKFIEAIEILAIRDSGGNDVFESTKDTRTPSSMYFAVSDELYSLLKKSDYISSNSIEIVPVPRNSSYQPKNKEEELKVSSEYLRQFILNKTAIVPENTNSNNNEDTENNEINEG